MNVANDQGYAVVREVPAGLQRWALQEQVGKVPRPLRQLRSHGVRWTKLPLSHVRQQQR